ncbi:hypothetical protein ACHAXR_004794 [Thalassiosira sp. AJA248-18]
MNQCNPVAAFTAKAPLKPLSVHALIQARRNENIFVARTVPQTSYLAMVPNNCDAVTNTIAESFNSQTVASSTNDVLSTIGTQGNVLSTQDIVIGTILAFALAFGYSFLNGQSSSSSFVSWPSKSRSNNDTLDINTSVPGSDEEGDKIFNEDNWKEMSREENYVLYNTKIRQKRNENSKKGSMQNMQKKENKLVLVALLVLFVPIFSVEFFFALSRQFICEMGMGGGELVDKLCSPILGR